MADIRERFNGYLKIENDTFAYSIADNTVTLLPAESDLDKQYESFIRARSHKAELPEFIYGTDGHTNIAFMRKSKFFFDHLETNFFIRFGTPLIVKAASFSSDHGWEKFHSITFYGGNINSVLNPEIALQSFNESHPTNSFLERRFKHPSDYTRSIDFMLDKKKVTLTTWVYQSWSRYDTGRRGAFSLGELDASISLTFEEPQDLSNIIGYYHIILKLISILTRKGNNSFDTYLTQIGKDGKTYQTAVCKIFDGFENYADINTFKSIPIYDIFDCLPNLITKIHNGETEPLLALLPTDNRRAFSISITNIQDMCTALEAAYPKQKREKDALITELKREIKETIKAFQKKHTDININSETTLCNCFQHLDFTLRQKILTMYNDNKKFIDPIIQKYHLPPLNNDTVRAFVNLRNNKTHGGAFELDKSAYIYEALLAIVYVQLFKSIELSEEMIESIMQYFI